MSLKEAKSAIKDVENDAERKRRELSERCYAMEDEARRYKQEYNRLAQMLKAKINSTIDNVNMPIAPRR